MWGLPTYQVEWMVWEHLLCCYVSCICNSYKFIYETFHNENGV